MQATSSQAEPGQVEPAPVDLTPFLRRDGYQDIKISPAGEYYAATVPLEDRTILAVLRRSDKAVTAKLQIGENAIVDQFWWVNDERVMASVAEKIGRNDVPSPTGELVAVNVDGQRGKWLTHRYADRFARGAGNDNVSKLYHREKQGAPWVLINDESVSGVVEHALGFSADGLTAYLQTERRTGPDAIVAWNPATGERKEVLADPVVDPYSAVLGRARRRQRSTAAVRR